MKKRTKPRSDIGAYGWGYDFVFKDSIEDILNTKNKKERTVQKDKSFEAVYSKK